MHSESIDWFLYMRATPAFNGLILEAKFGSLSNKYTAMMLNMFKLIPHIGLLYFAELKHFLPPEFLAVVVIQICLTL